MFSGATPGFDPVWTEPIVVRTLQLRSTTTEYSNFVEPNQDPHMHVIHLYDGHEQVYEGRGSVPNVVWNVARETAAAGHKVTVLERQWAGLPSEALHDGVVFERLKLHTGASHPWTQIPHEMVKRPVGLTKLVTDRVNFGIQSLRYLRNRDVDVLHVHLPFAANVLLSIAPSYRQSTVYTAHLGELRLGLLSDKNGTSNAHNNSPTDEPHHGSLSSGLQTPTVLSLFSPDLYLVKRACRTTVLNTVIKTAFADRGVPTTDLRVVPNGVDLHRFASVDSHRITDVRDQYGLGDRPVILFVGTIMPRKGVLDLLHAVTTVIESVDVHPQIVIAGDQDVDPAHTREVTETISKYDLDPSVSMTGFVPSEDLPALYSLADMLVLPSREEGFGMTAIEAMAAGTPVVATRVGGIPELLEAGRHGHLVEPGDVHALARAIVSVLTEDKTRPDVLQKRAKEFSWSTVTGHFLDVYGEVAA